MHAGATLFLDVCVQPDLWPGGAWPLLNADQDRNVVRLFALAADFPVRQGGIVCRHDAEPSGEPVGVPPHCRHVGAAVERPAGCAPLLPMQIASETAGIDSEGFERGTTIYVDSGCQRAPHETSGHRTAFQHLTAGVRDAVVFGAGVEYAIDRVVDALLQRRIRTHVVLDAVGAADEVLAQTIVARWKRRGVDGVTVAMVERLLARS